MYHLLGWSKSENFRTVTLYDNRSICWTSMIPYTVFATRSIYLIRQSSRNFNVSSSGCGPKVKICVQLLTMTTEIQPVYMLNFYDTSCSFCDEEYIPYQTKLREILMYHLLGWAKSENFRTVTLYDNQPIYWTSKIPYTVFATRSIFLIRQSSRNFNVPSSGGGPKVKICVQLLCRTTGRYAELLWYLIQLSRVPLVKFYKIFVFVPNRTIYRGHLRT